MSVADAIDSFLTGTYTVTRRGAATSVKGKITPGSTSTFQIQASLQPLGGRELLRLPEGQRDTERRLFFTKTELRNGDRVDAEGAVWVVERVEDWMELGGFYRATAAQAED